MSPPHPSRRTVAGVTDSICQPAAGNASRRYASATLGTGRVGSVGWRRRNTTATTGHHRGWRGGRPPGRPGDRRRSGSGTCPSRPRCRTSRCTRRGRSRRPPRRRRRHRRRRPGRSRCARRWGDVYPGHREALLCQVDGVVSEPAPDIEHRALDQSLRAPPDHVLLGRLGVPRNRGRRRHAVGRGLTAVERIEIQPGVLLLGHRCQRSRRGSNRRSPLGEPAGIVGPGHREDR